MKILVIVKQVIGENTQVSLNDGAIDHSATVLQTSSLDLVAIEQAVLLKEQGLASHLVVCTIGGREADKSLRTALAMGIDEAVHILADLEKMDALGYTRLLAAYISGNGFGLVITGREDFDGGGGKSCPMLASLLGWPAADYVTGLEKTGDKQMTVFCDGDYGKLELEMSLPTVLSVDSALNQPRFVKFPALMKARKQQVGQYTSNDFSVDLTPQYKNISLSTVKQQRKQVMLGNIEELAKILRDNRDL